MKGAPTRRHRPSFVQQNLRRLQHRTRRRDSGVIAVLTALMMFTFLSLCAFTIDVGHWYLVAEQEQRAADAAVLAGVVNLPGDPTTAYSVAQNFSRINGFPNGGKVSVQAVVVDKPTRLKVTVTSQVDNWFGALLGVPTTAVTRSATADYAAPVVMGSPCNEFGNDPTGDSSVRSPNCNNTGAFWANVGSLATVKSYGDAFQDGVCNGTDGCTGATNDDYAPDGYFYTVTLAKPITGLMVQAFDPAFVAVGDTCDGAGLNGAAGTLYAAGSSSPYCTGDVAYDSPAGSNVGNVETQFIIRQPGPASTPWDPTTYPVVGGCTTPPFDGYNPAAGTSPTIKSLAGIQDPNWANGDPVRQKLKSVFRQWATLCSNPGITPAGTYFVQVKTNGLGYDGAEGHNRFSLRAYSTFSSLDNTSISISGYQKMGIYANLPNASTTFHLARVPSSAAGHVLTVRLFDIGDSNKNGTVTVLAPDGNPYPTCSATGPVSGPSISPCSIVANSSFNGKWESISVPIPSTYLCPDDTNPAACWVKLNYSYGSGSQPSDTTSWTAALEGDPVRLVQ